MTMERGFRELSGRELARQLRAALAERAAALAKDGREPRLAVVTATDDGGSAAYVRSIANTAARNGIACDVARTTTRAGIAATITQLADDPEVHGIILQTPLPEGADLADLATAIPPAKDVDGASPESIGRLVAGLPAFAPATAEAVLALLDHYGVELRGRHAVVVGRSVVVGKPTAHLLLDRNATVTICHSRTADLPAITRQADVLVVAAGRAGLIGPGHVSHGTVVIDVGTNTTEDGSLAGDVDPAVAGVAAALTPVPGGVGPVTTALLLQHVVQAASLPKAGRCYLRQDVSVCRFYRARAGGFSKNEHHDRTFFFPLPRKFHWVGTIRRKRVRRRRRVLGQSGGDVRRRR